jgi:hypothetical protein
MRLMLARPSAIDKLGPMRTALALVALSFVSLPTQVGAAPLAPTGKWVVNFDAAQCVASRAYGDEQLFLKASPLGDVVQLGVMEPGRSGPPQQVLAEVRPTSGAAYNGNAVMWATSSDKPQRVRLINMPTADFERLSGSPSLYFRLGEMRREYAIPAMAGVAKVMKTCVDDLQKVWSAEGGTPAVAMASLASYFTDDDYPDEAVRANQSGTTGFALLVDEQGRVADCMVIATSGQSGLDIQSCAILKRRARFTPAKDTAGKPAKDRVKGRIAWRIP